MQMCNLDDILEIHINKIGLQPFHDNTMLVVSHTHTQNELRPTQQHTKFCSILNILHIIMLEEKNVALSRAIRINDSAGGREYKSE